MTLRSTVADTSSCSLTDTSWEPSDLMGWVDHDGALVDGLAGDVGERAGDLGGGDRTEQAAAGAGPDLDRNGLGLELGLDLLGVVLVAHGARGAGLLDRLDGLLAAAGPAHGQAAGHEVVAAVAVLDLDHVAGGAEAVDLLGQDELHVDSPQRPVDV